LCEDDEMYDDYEDSDYPEDYPEDPADAMGRSGSIVLYSSVATRLDIHEKRIPAESKGDPVREMNLRIHFLPDHNLKELEAFIHDVVSMSFRTMSPAERHGRVRETHGEGTGRVISRKENQ